MPILIIGLLRMKYLIYTTKYQPLLQLLQHLNCPFIENLRLGANATYTNEMIIQEFVTIMAIQVEKETCRFQDSTYVALMSDENIDICVLSC